VCVCEGEGVCVSGGGGVGVCNCVWLCLLVCFVYNYPVTEVFVGKLSAKYICILCTLFHCMCVHVYMYVGWCVYMCLFVCVCVCVCSSSVKGTIRRLKL
jgi:hypothetical protein